MEVENVIDAPLFKIWTSHASHVLTNNHRLSDSLQVLPAVNIHHCNLWIESHWEDFFLSNENAGNNSLSHIHDQLQIETWDKRADEVFVQDLAQWDPVKGQILVLGALKVILERHIYRFNSEERKRVKDC